MERAIILLCAALLLMSNTGCQTMQGRLNEAKRQEAVQEVKTPLPDWPVYCAEPMPTVIPKVGELFRHNQARWEVVRNNENKRIEWCAQHYGSIQEEYGSL